MRIRLSRVLALSCLVSAALPAGAADPPHGVFTPSEIKWEDAPPMVPKGAKLAVLYGDPNKDGLFVVRAKLPANYPPTTGSRRTPIRPTRWSPC